MPIENVFYPKNKIEKNRTQQIDNNNKINIGLYSWLSDDRKK